MKWVLHISALHADEGGPPRGVLSIATALAELGEEVHVVAMRQRGKSLPEPYLQAIASGVCVDLVLTRRLYPMRISLRIFYRLWRVAKGADVVTSHGFYQFTAIASYMTAVFRRARLFVQPHGVFEPYQEMRTKPAKFAYMTIIGRRILRRADYLFVASKQEKMGVIHSKASIESKIFHTGLGVDLSASSSRSNRNFHNRNVLFLSRLAPKKRLDLLIEACRELARTEDAFALLVCGTGEDRYTASLVRQAHGLPITFVGHVEGERRSSIESQASLFCLPSDNENFGQAITEAMAAGIPVITTAAAGASEHVLAADAGWVLDQPNAHDLARAISEALAHPLDLSDKSLRGVHYVQTELTWTAVARRWQFAASGPSSRASMNS